MSVALRLHRLDFGNNYVVTFVWLVDWYHFVLCGLKIKAQGIVWIEKERSHDTENHCGYLIILDLFKSPFVNTVLRPNLAETKVFTLRRQIGLTPG